MHSNNISFTSNIKFVNSRKYHALWRGRCITCDPKDSNIERASAFYTEGVRTCSAGGFASKNQQQALGFHLLDSLFNYEHINLFISTLRTMFPNPESVLLLGGKSLKERPFSTLQFQKMKEIFTKRYRSLTIFEEHTTPFAETNFYYSLADDTWYINTTNKGIDVRTLEDLVKSFKKIKISYKDNLYIEDVKINLKDLKDRDMA